MITVILNYSNNPIPFIPEGDFYVTIEGIDSFKPYIRIRTKWHEEEA